MKRKPLSSYLVGERYRFYDEDDGEEFIANVIGIDYHHDGAVRFIDFKVTDYINSKIKAFSVDEEITFYDEDDYSSYKLFLLKTIKPDTTNELNYIDNALLDLYIDMALATKDKAWFDELCKHRMEVMS